MGLLWGSAGLRPAPVQRLGLRHFGDCLLVSLGLPSAATERNTLLEESHRDSRVQVRHGPWFHQSCLLSDRAKLQTYPLVHVR